jgi:hypothetical protein
MEAKMSSTTKQASLHYLPDPRITPAWQYGDGANFVAADFRADGHGRVLIIAVRHHPVGDYEEVERLDIDADDAEGYAADLIGDLIGGLNDEGIYGWENGDLAKSVARVLNAPAIAAE